MPEVVEQDPIDLMLKKTGCIDYHYRVQECIAEFGDWRHCQNKVQDFKKCMQKYVDAQNQKYAHIK
ncbi:cytochrome c oxidase assembly factor 4 homolog, mitochondrial [Glossina fuscipes]|uniref:Cytochrome c oxidase assembly factor 4 homolog, mitochondrial n=2 Tax=Nemorhina TaxID=44051 RepID=A0A9C5YUT5_9MUSC|nr:cytochrome c oxidase assembly factor 4 homolog, mitochondrial [Glossina fuscipes]KAI9582851.1 hypothetical protein GQX74_012068 [Glossina fuscipes]